MPWPLWYIHYIVRGCALDNIFPYSLDQWYPPRYIYQYTVYLYLLVNKISPATPPSGGTLLSLCARLCLTSDSECDHNIRCYHSPGTDMHHVRPIGIGRATHRTCCQSIRSEHGGQGCKSPYWNLKTLLKIIEWLSGKICKILQQISKRNLLWNINTVGQLMSWCHPLNLIPRR